MNDEELELALFGNQENEEGDIALDHDISSIMESISRNVRYASTPRNIDVSLDLQRTIPTRTIDTIPISMTLDESRIRPMMAVTTPSVARANTRGIRADNVYYDTEGPFIRNNEIVDMIRNSRVRHTETETETKISDDDLYTKTKIAGDMYMKYKNDSGYFQIEKIREETMHSSPRKMFRYINSSGHRDTISVSKNFEDALGGLRIEDDLDRYKEIVEDAINVINILSSTNDRLYMNFNMTNSALSESKESVRYLNNQLVTVKMNFDKLMAFTRK